MFKRIVPLISLISLVLIPGSNAVVNGKSVVGADYVVTLYLTENGSGFCTGIYFSPKVVITAAHCVVKEDGRAGDWRTSMDTFYVSYTGVNWSSETERKRKSKVLKIWVDPSYYNRYVPDKGEYQTQKNDIAFLYLDNPLEGKHLTRAATKAETEEFKTGRVSGVHIGYGCIGDEKGEVVGNDGKPYRVDGVTGNFGSDPSGLNSKDVYLGIDYPSGTSLCPGDSGSGLFFERNGEAIFLATIYAGGGWQNAAKKDTSSRGVGASTAFWSFKEIYESELSNFLREESLLKEKIEMEKNQLADQRNQALASGTFYKETTGCHARNVNAELQILEDGIWRRLVAAKGWDESCDLRSNPVQPWAIADVPKGSMLRWRIWATGSWEALTVPFKETSSDFRARLEAEASATAEANAAAEAEIEAGKAAEAAEKQRLEEEARADAEAETTALLEKATMDWISKRVLLNCYKGKRKITVIGENPRCPFGYKKK